MRHARWILLPAALLAVVGLAGCGQRSATTVSQAPAADKVELTEATYAGFDQAVKEQKGKVVMIDIWSLG
jgi:hypothetical protein